MRKNIYILFTISFPIFFFAQELRTSPELEKIFTKVEIEDLNILVDYFESKMHTKGVSVEEMYTDVLYSSATYDDSFFSSNIFNLEDLESTFDKIDKNIFKEIWNYSGTIYINKDSVISLNPSPNGKYVKFLKEVGVNRPKVEKYALSIFETSELGRLNNIFVKYDYDKEEIKIVGDLNDYNNKVIITVHILTIVDFFCKREKMMEH